MIMQLQSLIADPYSINHNEKVLHEKLSKMKTQMSSASFKVLAQEVKYYLTAYGIKSESKMGLKLNSIL